MPHFEQPGRNGAAHGAQTRDSAADAVHTVERVAAGIITEAQLAEWFRQRQF